MNNNTNMWHYKFDRVALKIRSYGVKYLEEILCFGTNLGGLWSRRFEITETDGRILDVTGWEKIP